MENFDDVKMITDRDIVCPECLIEIDGYSFDKNIETRQGYSLRRYFGWCSKCERGFEVIQFKEAGQDRWSIHKYKIYGYAVSETTNRKIIPNKDWKTLLELPEPPLVMMGPGGDYDEQYNYHLENTIESLDRTLQTALRSINILRRMVKKDGIHNHKKDG